MSKERLHNLIERLEGEALATAEAQIEKLVPPAVKITFGRHLKNDFTKHGYKLVSIGTELPKGETKLDAIPVLKDGEEPTSGKEMLKRAVSLKVINQYDAEDLCDHLNGEEGKQASEDLKGKYYPTTTVYESASDPRERYVPLLYWYDGRWVMRLGGLSDPWGADGLLLVPRKA